MASVEDSPGNGASKKRVASRQITKDDDPETEEEVAVEEGGSFKKAPEAVLASRRIVKVRRSGNIGAPAGGANPFASIRLIPPPQAAAQVSAEGSAEATGSGADGEVGASGAEGGRAEESKQDGAEEGSAEGGSAAAAEAALKGAEGESGSGVEGTKVSTEGGASNGVSAAAEAETGAEGATDGKAGESESGRDTSAPAVSSSETFQQLSSAKNAFSASFGTGFSSQSTSVGSSGAGLGGFTGASGGFGSLGGFAGSTGGFGLFGSFTGAAGGLSSFGSLAGGSGGVGSLGSLGGGGGAASAGRAGAGGGGAVTLQEVALETGEEKEKAVFGADASLFEFHEGGWKERGKGEIKVSVPEDVQRRPRLVMRSKGNLRLLLNANIFPDMKITKMDNRGVTFVCANSTGDGSAKAMLTTYALKFRDPQIAREFMSTVESHKGAARSAEPRTPESSPKAVDRPAAEAREEGSKDVEAGTVGEKA
ncbi:uncharacterized protein [Physcomitrium patens]|nr:nuclear pore complex protein NUP50B-like [Physcomitrium patens]XP_024369418.1 nuclear pore complex protein NUP50B-like [Physcomitrium patens]XP_024369419.1 nuclear pore complex protein NUP50B-like [Physcomitrium patens]PNR57077.1 hypothetical protein PHYPA_004070 [Physcomitrium patens]|eukprot:XP_024369416.1 nuclear pore complex protein NUP50B-like [Physcomitrella patens]